MQFAAPSPLLRLSALAAWVSVMTSVNVAAAPLQSGCTAPSADCVEVGQLNINVSLGAGVRTNPVIGESDIPLVVIPQISYYGKRFFLENLDVGARPGHWTKERVFELFPNIAERLSNRGNQLSGGEQQMLSIARALLTNPSVLLMDEPTEGLAPVIVETLTAALIKLRGESGLSIILVEQNSRVAFEFSDRSVVLDKGRIVYDGASAALRDDPERLAKIIGVSE